MQRLSCDEAGHFVYRMERPRGGGWCRQRRRRVVWLSGFL